MSAPSYRRVLLDLIKERAKKSRNSSYFVKRGVIDWATFPFARYPRALAIMVDEFGPVAHPERVHDATISIEAAARMPDQVEFPEIDDGLLDELIDDIENEIVREIPRTLDVAGDTVAHVLKFSESSFKEFHDIGLKVQGVVCQFNVGGI